MRLCFLLAIANSTLFPKDKIKEEKQDDIEEKEALEEMREYQEKVTEKLKNSKRENTAYEKVYLPNPRSLFDHRYRPDEQMVKKNVKWLEEIHYNPGQANFMRQVINLPNQIPFIPYFAATQIDPTPFCWILVMYDSGIIEKRKAVFRLVEGLTKFYHERCGVSPVDLGYPSNAETFSEFKSKTLPFFLIKNPLSAYKMLHTKSLKIRPTGSAAGNFQLNPVAEWGQIISNSALKNDFAGSMNKINEIFETSSQNIRMAALLMEHYHEYDKTRLEMILSDSMDPVRTYARNIVEARGLKMSAD